MVCTKNLLYLPILWKGFILMSFSFFILPVDGYYWGRLIFPKEYPFRPPRIEMSTPSGRFQTNTRFVIVENELGPCPNDVCWITLQAVFVHK